MKKSATPTFRSYELPGLLYGDQRLILNLACRIVTLLGGHGQPEAQTCFAASALAVTQALVDAHPAPCPLDALYAAFAGVERAAAREILAGCRAQLATFNLGVQPVPEAGGYRLFRLFLP